MCLSLPEGGLLFRECLITSLCFMPEILNRLPAIDCRPLQTAIEYRALNNCTLLKQGQNFHLDENVKLQSMAHVPVQRILALYRTPLINAQCWPTNSGIDLNVNQFQSMQINAMIGNDRHWEPFRINAIILIGIDRHRTLIEWVLIIDYRFMLEDGHWKDMVP